MPFEVWKTYMGTYRDKSTLDAFKIIYREGGIRGFYRGLQPKMVESFLKGGILLYAKEASIRSLKGLGVGDASAGLLGGFFGGVAQVTVMGPCTFLVTAAVTGDKSTSIFDRIRQTFKAQGIKGFYHGGTALVFRQGTNWASRQGLTDIIRQLFLKSHKDGSKKLSVFEEAASGIMGKILFLLFALLSILAGGILSTWNQPFEVMRIEAQAAAARGDPPKGIMSITSMIVKQHGVLGLFQGVIPRMGLCVW